MKRKLLFLSFVVLGALLARKTPALGQTQHEGRYLLGAVVIGHDTLPAVYLQDVEVFGKMDPKRRSELNTLRYNVQKVYPYAVTAAYVLEKVDHEMSLKSKKKDRKAYLKEVEKEMNARFKDELKNLSMTQGKILVKLINRQTGREVYDIIKDIKGGFNARIYQTTAFFFKNNLKKQYDPFGEDKDIEMIVQEIESKTYLPQQRIPLDGRLAN